MNATHGEEQSFARIPREFLDNLLEGCQVIGFDHRYLYVNYPVAKQGRLSKEQLIGRTMTECFPGIDKTNVYSVMQRCMESRVHIQIENEFTFPDGRTGYFELRFVPVPEGVMILSLDITERRRAEEALKRTEEQLRHAHKMEAVGRLAGGIAHDFNNLLSVILTYAELLGRGVPPGAPRSEEIAEIKKAGERAAALTRQLLVFSRQEALELDVLDMNEVILGMDPMLQRLIGEDVSLTTVPGLDLGRVRADRGQIEQILMNLVVNARDAMPTGGYLTIETGNTELDEGYARDHLGVKAGPYSMLAVSDTGIGMDKATQARIFEPFFTTKEKGKGTGLGLATVFGLVQQSDGHIWVYSEPGKGTTFKIYIPRTDAVATQRSETGIDLATLNGTETILLVEDDEQVRGVVRTILIGFGYQVLEAQSVGDALVTCEHHGSAIHLLLTDVVMPGMSGPDLARRLAPLRPQMRVLCMSGYTDEAVLRHGLIDSGLAFLQKPITPEKLARKIREVLAPTGGMGPGLPVQGSQPRVA